MYRTFCLIKILYIVIQLMKLWPQLHNYITHSLQNLQNLVNQQYRAHSAILTTNSAELLNLIETEYRVSILYLLWLQTFFHFIC